MKAGPAYPMPRNRQITYEYSQSDGDWKTIPWDSVPKDTIEITLPPSPDTISSLEKALSDRDETIACLKHLLAQECAKTKTLEARIFEFELESEETV